MKTYRPAEIEPKWQQVWDQTGIYRASDTDTRQKYYYLVEFPYPSGEGLHIGHVRSYTALDIMARHKRMQGYNVLYPMGFDAFGLPTENFAIKNKIAPQVATAQNVANFTRQLKSLGLSFDWDRTVNTTDPEYYRWTQWIFLQLLDKGLAYQSEMPINWCPHCKTGLANEEVVNGLHERCGTPVEKKLLNQWMLKITAYADSLVKDLDKVDYLDRIAVQQVNWIGRSEGAEIKFDLQGLPSGSTVTVYTTRPDTLFGATFIVVSPELAKTWLDAGWSAESKVKDYVSTALNEQEIVRQERTEKTGVDTGIKAVHPLSGELLPVWVADYVLGGYGTGAIMAVPAHDQRDLEFAETFGLEVKRVLDEQDMLINSGEFNGLSVEDGKQGITKVLTEKGAGEKSTKYRLRDWIFSRQHYWGEPIPVVHCPKDGVVPVPEDQLPVTLPEVEFYEPTDTGDSPLAAITDWVNTECPKCGAPAKRETDTMPNWAGSSWYFLRYIDPHNNTAFADHNKLKYWLEVDLYNGGMEHTTLHLLYSRFWHKFLYDQKLVPTPEPYARRRSHGMILGPDGRKMSKSLGNVINPDQVVERYGADAIRLYEMFMGPFDEQTSWSDERLSGVSRFLYRVWTLAQDLIIAAEQQPADQPNTIVELEVDRATHKTLKKVGEDIEGMRFNTMVSSLMEYINLLTSPRVKSVILAPANMSLAQRTLRHLILILAPAVPHMTEELWNQLGETESVHMAAWPKYDPQLIKDDVAQIVVQVNGKLRANIALPSDSDKDTVVTAAKADPKVSKYLDNGEIIKVIYIPLKLINFVVK